MSTEQTTPHPHDEIVGFARELGRADRDWAILAEGNCSFRTDSDTMLVKASGAWMSRATEADFVPVSLSAVLELIDSPDAGDADVTALFDTVVAATGRRPSVEALLHAVCLDLPGITAVGHTHPTFVNSLLCSPRAEALVEGSLFPDQIVVLGTDPLLVPYVDPGLKLAQVVRGMLATRDRVPRAIYLRNHGMFALGNSAAEVIQITQMAVKVSHVILGSIAAGGPTFMDPAEVRRIDTRPDELLRRDALAAANLEG